MFDRTGTVIIYGGTLTMTAISKFGCSFIAFHQYIHQTALLIDRGNPTPNLAQEGVSATTGSQTSDTGPGVAI